MGVIRGQRLVTIAPPFLSPHQCCPAISSWYQRTHLFRSQLRNNHLYSLLSSVLCSLVLVRETVLLIHKVSIHDRFFDTHRENCDLSLISVLNTLSWLLEAIPEIHEGRALEIFSKVSCSSTCTTEFRLL